MGFEQEIRKFIRRQFESGNLRNLRKRVREFIEKNGFAAEFKSRIQEFIKEVENELFSDFKDTYLGGEEGLKQATISLSDYARKHINEIQDMALYNMKRIDRRIIREVSKALEKGIKGNLNWRDIAQAALRKYKLNTTHAKTEIRTTMMALDNVSRIAQFKLAGITHLKYVGPTNTKRPFCQMHINKIYKIEEVENMLNRFRQPALFYMGGYNCRHRWAPVLDNGKSLDIVTTTGASNKMTEEELEKTLIQPQLNVKRLIERKFNVRMPLRFYRDDFEEEVIIKRMNSRNAWYKPSIKEIKIGTRRFDTEFKIKMVLAHEAGGHHRHTIQRLITNNHVDQKVVTEFNRHYGVIDFSKVNEFREKLSYYYRNVNNKIEFTSNFVRNFANNHPEYDAMEIIEMVAATSDYFGALTFNRIGSGHSSLYYALQPNNKYMEWFAHCSENYYVGNPYFKEAFPEFYDLTINFMESIKK